MSESARDERQVATTAPGAPARVSGKGIVLVFVGLTVGFSAAIWWASKVVRPPDASSPAPSASVFPDARPPR